MYLIMGHLFKLVGEICEKEKKGDPFFLFFATNLIHELTRRMLIFFMLELKSKAWKSEIGRF